jgi:hypothetical protein
MTRHRWFRSSLTCELRAVRHLENRIVFCNDCFASRTLRVSASGTLDCSDCGSQNWMHLAVPLANRGILGFNYSQGRTVPNKPSSAPEAGPPIVAQAGSTTGILDRKRLYWSAFERVPVAANHLVAGLIHAAVRPLSLSARLLDNLGRRLAGPFRGSGKTF